MSQAPIPSALRSTDLARFLNKASQLEKIKPVIAYWCEYWIVNQILAKGLHNGDPETYQFTTALMDKLELIKAENPTNDAILDDTAGQVYVEQFALEVFQRAEKAMRANKATKQTAITFQAAATFLELVNIWSTPDAETSAKIKYAKWNAVQILRAISQGKDPNIVDTNEEVNDYCDFPKIQPNGDTIEPDGPTNLLPTDIEGHYDKTNVQSSESVTSLNYPIQSSGIANIPEKPYDSEPCPLEEAMNASSIMANSLDNVGNNIRTLQDGLLEIPRYDENSLNPKQRAMSSDSNISTGISQLSQNKTIHQQNRGFESFPPPGLSEIEPRTSQMPGCPTTLQASPHPKHPVSSCDVPGINQTTQATSEWAPEKNLQNKIIIDDLSMIAAQKHARWAISALNFEDSDTAVRELKKALKILGAG